MSRVLIPRSATVSAKKIATSDFEKYFTHLKDYVICGFTLSAQCPNILGVNISSGNARISGLHANNTATCTKNCLTACNTNYIYAEISRDGCCEAQSWSFTSNTTGTTPTDAILLGTATTNATTVTAVDNTLKINQNLVGFVGKGCEIDCETTYPGMKAYATTTACCYESDVEYTRNAANDTWVRTNVPVGGVIMWTGTEAGVPVGWFICDGQAISRTTYAKLFAAVGTEYGVGDGCTTFNVPDFQSCNRFPRASSNDAGRGGTGGSSTVTLTTCEIPSHAHTVNKGGTGGAGNDLALCTGTCCPATQSTSSIGGGAAHENKPPYLDIHFIIRAL